MSKPLFSIVFKDSCKKQNWLGMQPCERCKTRDNCAEMINHDPGPVLMIFESVFMKHRYNEVL